MEDYGNFIRQGNYGKIPNFISRMKIIIKVDRMECKLNAIKNTAKT